MKKTTVSYHQFEVFEALTLGELCKFCHVGQDWIETLVEHGVLEPYGPDVTDWRFDPVNVARARKSQRLVQDFGLNAAGLALVLDLMDERDELASKIAHLMMH